MQGYVYILHFDRPHYHAAHYTGSTKNLRQRLCNHARGHGSRLTRALMFNGIDWQLGGLYVATIKQCRRMEAEAKSNHQGSRFCFLCRPDHSKQMSEAIPYDLANVPFPTTSHELRHSAPILTPPELRWMHDAESPPTWEALRRLQKQDNDALGFIPTTGPAGLTVLAAQGKILLASHGDTVLGYAAFTVNRNSGTVRIQQTVVDDKHRLTGIGAAMLDRIENTYLDLQAACKVREDLPANAFWQAQGYLIQGTSKHITSGHTLIHYRKENSHGFNL